jgi:hypothetical protein
MVKHTRIKPWLTLPISVGNAIQIGGLLGGMLLARRAANFGRRGTSWLYTGRLLAYFCEHGRCWLAPACGWSACSLVRCCIPRATYVVPGVQCGTVDK